jgi:hypothetical protein
MFRFVGGVVLFLLAAKGAKHLYEEQIDLRRRAKAAT